MTDTASTNRDAEKESILAFFSLPEKNTAIPARNGNQISNSGKVINVPTVIYYINNLIIRSSNKPNVINRT